MGLFSTFKRNARLALRGKWGRAILILIITMGASSVLTGLQNTLIDLFAEPVSFDPLLAARYGVADTLLQQFAQTSPVELGILAAFTVVSLLLFAPLDLGTARWYYQVVLGRDPGVGEIFRYFESGRLYARSLWFTVNLSVRTFLWAALFYAVPGAIFGCSLYVIWQGENVSRPITAIASVGLLLGVLLALLASVFFGAVVNKYLLAAYLLAEDEALTVREAIRRSVAQTKGYRFSLLWYQLTFIGWILLCAFVLPALYTVPYLSVSIAMYARYIIERRRQDSGSFTQEFSVEESRPADEASPGQAADSGIGAGAPSEEPAPTPEPNVPADEESGGFRFPASRIQPRPEPDASPVPDALSRPGPLPREHFIGGRSAVAAPEPAQPEYHPAAPAEEPSPINPAPSAPVPEPLPEATAPSHDWVTLDPIPPLTPAEPEPTPTAPPVSGQPSIPSGEEGAPPENGGLPQ